MRGPAPQFEQYDGVMVFDGICHLGSGFVRFALRFDANRAIRFTPLQSRLGRHLALTNGVDLDDPLTFLFLLQPDTFFALAAP